MKMRVIIIMTVILIIGMLSASAGVAAPDKAGGGVHVVQWGENLASIAARYGTTVEALAQANGITNQNYIYIGQQLVIPSLGNAQGPLPGAQVPLGSPTGGSYAVKFGDTLTSIALRYGTSVDQLMQANGLTSSTIYIGQPLAVPGPAGANEMNDMGMGPAPVPAAQPSPGSLYSVKAGDTLSAIAFRFGTSVNDIMQVNNLYSTSIMSGQQLIIPGRVAIGVEQPAGTYYTIQRGDTLAGIALRYGTTLQSILQANNLSQSQFIFPGQELVVPGMMHNPLPQQAVAPGMMQQIPQQAMVPGMTQQIPQQSMAPGMVSQVPQQAMAPGMIPEMPQQPMVSGQSVPMSVPSGNPSMGAPVIPSQPVAPMIAPNVSAMRAPSPLDGRPITPPGMILDNEPFVISENFAPPDLTMQWQGQIVSQTQPEDWKYPAVLRVNVGGAKGMQVTVSKKGSGSWSTTGFTGTKPEYGDGAVEFAPLNPGKHIVCLDGQGKGSSMTVDIKPNSLTYVEFVRVRADSSPTS